MRQLSAERIHNYDERSTTITENAATVAEQGAHVAPEKASSKKGASLKTFRGMQQMSKAARS
jgi:hypothetical protein